MLFLANDNSKIPRDFFEMQVEEQKQAAADVLNNYSQFAMVCIGEEVRPCDLRLHLMKEISGMRSTLKKNPPSTAAASPNSTGKASSSGTTKEDMAESS
ncbi:unnamed protein product [Spirodela intermedia]|uniref:Uncharacterized protein n=2 Tax=Spirodela intermedia TaxID=51605 RepID=A0A7I8KK85_SPIIN|nr:unnamed protein product [Spirodela intermedia]CAA6661838.1 unnamed protein product [Spirodela intermedia]CAA6675440.1 unnamed protein product [Spirodela intermedia]CAA7398209.1 unnamed protein product [Spirodela intermedia]